MDEDKKRISSSDEIWVIDFTADSAQQFREDVMSHVKGDHNKPVVVYIDSYGGQVDALAKMIETMDEIPNPIVTVCMGKAMSCGAVLLSHGDVRFCGPHSRVMVHEVSAGTSGDVHDMKTDTDEAHRLNEWFLGLLAHNCGYKGYAQLRKIIKGKDGRDVYMNAKSALEFGIIDAVGLPKINSATLYEVVAIPRKSRIRDKMHSSTRKRRALVKSDRNKQKRGR